MRGKKKYYNRVSTLREILYKKKKKKRKKKKKEKEKKNISHFARSKVDIKNSFDRKLYKRDVLRLYIYIQPELTHI